MSSINPYKVLGVEIDDDAQAIKKAYHKLCLRHHPDKAGQSPEAHEFFVLIQAAYEALSKGPQARDFAPEFGSRDRDASDPAWWEREYFKGFYERRDWWGGSDDGHEDAAGNDDDDDGDTDEEEEEEEGKPRKSKRWYEKHSGKHYQKIPKAYRNVRYQSCFNTMEAVGEMEQDVLAVQSRFNIMFEKYHQVAPGSEQAVWIGLETVSDHIGSRYAEVLEVQKQVKDVPAGTWKQNETTRSNLASIRSLRDKIDVMKTLLTEMEATALAAGRSCGEERKRWKRLFRTQVARWD